MSGEIGARPMVGGDESPHTRSARHGTRLPARQVRDAFGFTFGEERGLADGEIDRRTEFGERPTGPGIGGVGEARTVGVFDAQGERLDRVIGTAHRTAQRADGERSTVGNDRPVERRCHRAVRRCRLGLRERPGGPEHRETFAS
jgi:hypothetical protein